ncbi:MAG: hypothetical protein H7138_20640 [Myxococcales bacterium]|nr:hypothetical protein [Myxococcales bacterium]
MKRWMISLWVIGCGGGGNSPGGDAGGGVVDSGSRVDSGVVVVDSGTSGSDASTDIGPEHPTYDNDIAPILTASCVTCHDATPADGASCVRLDRWFSAVDTAALCGDTRMAGLIFGARDAGPIVLDQVTQGLMPIGGPLPSAQIALFERWRRDGYPKHVVNGAPTITVTAPPAGGVTLCDPGCTYDVAFVVGDPDGDEVSWSLGWSSGATTGTFATRLAGGTGTLTIDGSALLAGDYTLTATLDDGASTVTVAALGSFTIAAAHNAEPTVTVTAPNGGEAFRSTDAITVTWTGSDADGATLTYDVVALQGATVIPIQTGLTAPVGQTVTTIWTPPAVAALTPYRIQVTARDAGTPPLAASDTSDATFSVSPPPVVISFATQIQPILTANCTNDACHDAVTPQRGLNLTAGAAYAELLNSRSTQTACRTFRLVQPSDPDLSYILFKLAGTGPCFVGGRMPQRLPPLPAAQIQLIRDWIANGAPNN